jgi:hypothetical protein
MGLGYTYAVFDETSQCYVKGRGTSNNRQTFTCRAWQEQANPKRIKPVAFTSIDQIAQRIERLNSKLIKKV